MARHTHHLRPTWILVMSPADLLGWYRVIMGAYCTDCGVSGTFVAEQSTRVGDGRLVEGDL